MGLSEVLYGWSIVGEWGGGRVQTALTAVTNSCELQCEQITLTISCA